jgi:hypothetical protein
MALGDHDLALLLLPPVFLGLGAGVLLLLSYTFKGITIAASKTFAGQGPLQKAVQPYIAQYVKPAVESLFGSTLATGGFAVRLEHLLLAAILIVLLGIWRSIAIQTEAIKASAKKRSEKREARGGNATKEE